MIWDPRMKHDSSALSPIYHLARTSPSFLDPSVHSFLHSYRFTAVGSPSSWPWPAGDRAQPWWLHQTQFSGHAESKRNTPGTLLILHQQRSTQIFRQAKKKGNGHKQTYAYCVLKSSKREESVLFARTSGNNKDFYTFSVFLMCCKFLWLLKSSEREVSWIKTLRKHSEHSWPISLARARPWG